MSQEELDFIFFRDNQLKFVDFSTGQLDVYIKDKLGRNSRSAVNVGSKSHDGYVRLWCNRRLRMKHRLLFWLRHGYLPQEVDHENKIRDDNSESNLIDSTRSKNTVNKTPRTYKQLTKEQVVEIAKVIATGEFSITGLAKDFGRSRVQIKAILAKKYWSQITDPYF